MALRSNRVYVSPPVYMLRSDRPNPTAAQNDRDRGPMDRKARANERSQAQRQPSFHPLASTSQRCQRAREIAVVSRVVTQPATLLSSAELRNANVAHSTTNSDQATA